MAQSSYDHTFFCFQCKYQNDFQFEFESKCVQYLSQQLKMEGFLVTRWLPKWPEAIGQMAQWIMEGKLKTPQTVVEGFEKMPDALIGLFTGANKGKMVVKA